MKKLFLFIAFIIVSYVSFSQSITQRSTGVTTVLDPNLFTSRSFRPPVAADTTALNLIVSLDSCGKIAFTYDWGLWYRGCSPKRWIQIYPGFNPGTDTLAWSVRGNDVTNLITQPFLGTTSNNPLRIATNNTIRLRIPETGIVRRYNNPVDRFLMQDTTTKNLYYSEGVPIYALQPVNILDSSDGNDYIRVDTTDATYGLATQYDLTQISASSALSSITAGVAANSINSAANKQTWAWNSLAGDKGMVFSSSSTAAASDAQTLVSIELSGVNGTAGQATTGLNVLNSHTGTTSDNIGGFFASTGGATSNIGITGTASGAGSSAIGGQFSGTSGASVRGLVATASGGSVSNTAATFTTTGSGSLTTTGIAVTGSGSTTVTGATFDATGGTVGIGATFTGTGSNAANSIAGIFTGNVIVNGDTPEQPLTIGKDGANTGGITLWHTDGGGVNVLPQTGTLWNLSLPANDGDANQVLSTNGSGVTSWVSNGITALTSGSATTANGTAVDLGGTASGNISIDLSAQTFEITNGTLTTNSIISSGTYTPANSNDLNIDAVTWYDAQYMRVGKVYTVSGKIDIDLASGGTGTFSVSIPAVGSGNITNDYQAGGTGYSSGAPGLIRISGDGVDRIMFTVETASSANRTYYYSYTYIED